MERIGDITYSVFERFSIFQIIGKNPKINKFFFDEKSSNFFWMLKTFCLKNLSMFMTLVEKVFF